MRIAIKIPFILFLSTNPAVIAEFFEKIEATIEMPLSKTTKIRYLTSYDEYRNRQISMSLDDDFATTRTIECMSSDWIGIMSAGLLTDYYREHIEMNGHLTTIQEFDEQYWSAYAAEVMRDAKLDYQNKHHLLEDLILSEKSVEDYYKSLPNDQSLFSNVEEFTRFTQYFPTTDTLKNTIEEIPVSLNDAYNSYLLEAFEFPKYVKIYVDNELESMGHGDIATELHGKKYEVAYYSYAYHRFMMDAHRNNITLSTPDAGASWTIITNNFIQTPAPQPLDRVWP